MTPTLSVRGLTTSFRVGGQWRAVVRNLSFDVAAARDAGDCRRIRLRQERRLALDLAAAADGSSRVEGSVRLEAAELLTLAPEEMRQVRGAGIAMIFQEPMTSLNPILTIGEQIARR